MAVGCAEDWGELQAILGLAATCGILSADRKRTIGQSLASPFVRFTCVDNTIQEMHTSRSYLLAFSSLEVPCGHGVC